MDWAGALADFGLTQWLSSVTRRTLSPVVDTFLSVPGNRLVFQCLNGTPFYLVMEPGLPDPTRLEHAVTVHHTPARRLIRRSGPYNCAGLVFAGRRGWLFDGERIDALGSLFVTSIDPAVRGILRADGFVAIPRESAATGDVVTYGVNEVEHVGLVTRRDPARGIMVVSKFGAWGEYEHEIDDVPDGLGTPDQIWRMHP